MKSICGEGLRRSFTPCCHCKSGIGDSSWISVQAFTWEGGQVPSVTLRLAIPWQDSGRLSSTRTARTLSRVLCHGRPCNMFGLSPRTLMLWLSFLSSSLAVVRPRRLVVFMSASPSSDFGGSESMPLLCPGCLLTRVRSNTFRMKQLHPACNSGRLIWR